MALRELFAKFEFAWDHSALAKITGATQAAEAKVQQLGRGFDRASLQATAARGPFAAWAALARANGASSKEFGAAVRELTAAARAAGAGGTRLRGVFGELGVDVDRLNAKGRSSASVWTEVTGRLAAVTDAATRTRLAVELLGESSANKVVLPAVAGGREALRANLRAERPARAAAAAPAVSTAPVVTGATQAQSALARLRQAWQTAFTGGSAPKAKAQLDATAAAAKQATVAAGGMRGAFRDALGALGVFGGAFGAVFTGRAIVTGIDNTLKQADALAKTSKQLGVTATALQSMTTFADLGGVSAEELRISISTMTRNLGIFAATGTGRVKAVLKEMGSGIDDIEGRKPADLFYEFGKSIAAIEDPVRRSAFAQRIFGESGVRLLSAFTGTAEEIDRVRERAELLGVVYSEDFAASAEEVNDELMLAGLQFQRVKVGLVSSLIPALRWAAGIMVTLGQRISSVSERTNVFKAAFATGGWMLALKIFQRLTGGIGGIRGMLSKVFPLLGRMARVLAPWLAWTLILDDIMTFLQGGDSALGRFLDTLFGAGTAAQVLTWIRDRWVGIREAIISTARAIQTWVQGLDENGKKAVAIAIAIGLGVAAGFGPIALKLIALNAQILVHIARIGAAGIAWAAGEIAALAFAGSLKAIALAAGSITIAIGAVILAAEQLNALLEEIGGWVGMLGGVKSLLKGDGFFAGVDAVANAKAKAAAADRARKREADAAQAGTGTRVPAGGAPALPAARTAAGGRSTTLTDQRSLTVNVSTDKPAATAAAVQTAVGREQRTNLRAVQAALQGAPRG
jgi:hypothetical protein